MSFVCCICGEEHEGFPALAYHRPDYWVSLSKVGKFLGFANNDFCRTLDGHRFVRCVLEIPIHDGPELALGFGLWSSLSKANFRRYGKTYNDIDQSKLGVMFGWLSNEVKLFPGSIGLKCDVHPQDGKQRPILVLQEANHPMYEAQQSGISFEEASRLVHEWNGGLSRT